MSFPAILVLEDGSIIEGNGFGAKEPSVGEIVFNTSMSGYRVFVFAYLCLENAGKSKVDAYFEALAHLVLRLIGRELAFEEARMRVGHRARLAGAPAQAHTLV